MKVFVSHDTRDTWVARQMARCIQDTGAGTFVDAYDLRTGDRFAEQIRLALLDCDELVALLTPWAAQRLRSEAGAMWLQGKRVCAILHGISARQLQADPKAGAGLFAPGHARELNDFDIYLSELQERGSHGS